MPNRMLRGVAALGISATLTIGVSPVFPAAAGTHHHPRSHAPRGKVHSHRHADYVRFHGWAHDSDRTHGRVRILLRRNGHRVDSLRTNSRTHRFTLHARMVAGRNTFVVVARDVGAGTHDAVLRTMHRTLKHAWVYRYHGNHRVAAQMFGHYHWGHAQFRCLDHIWSQESGWYVYAGSPEGAYGIPQAFPGSKMATAGPHWRTNARTQIRWGLRYIKARYGSPKHAWRVKQSGGSY